MKTNAKLSKKLAFVNERIVKENKAYIYLDFADWFSGDDARIAAAEDNEPNAASLNNNFYIRNTAFENQKYELKPDALLFALEGAQMKPRSYEEFCKEDLANRLFHASFIENNLVLLEEQYRP